MMTNVHVFFKCCTPHSPIFPPLQFCNYFLSRLNIKSHWNHSALLNQNKPFPCNFTKFLWYPLSNAQSETSLIPTKLQPFNLLNWSWIKFVFVRDSHDSNHIGLGLAPFLNKPTSPTYQIQSHKVRLKSLSLSPIWCCLVDGNVQHKLLSAIQSYLNFSMPPYAYDTATAMGIATTLSSI